MLDLGWWQAFNLADVSIVVGIGVLFASMEARPAHKARPAGFEPAAHGLEVHCSVQTELRAHV